MKRDRLKGHPYSIRWCSSNWLTMIGVVKSKSLRAWSQKLMRNMKNETLVGLGTSPKNILLFQIIIISMNIHDSELITK